MLPTYPTQDCTVGAQAVRERTHTSGKRKFQFLDDNFNDDSQIPQKHQTNLFTLLEEHIHASQANTQFKPILSNEEISPFLSNPKSQNCSFPESNFESKLRQQLTHTFQSNNPVSSTDQIPSKAAGTSSPLPSQRVPFSYPSPLHPHIQRHTELRPVSEVVSPYSSIFPYPYFNLVQSLCFDPLLYSDESLVISAPTGSGKTGVFELALVRWLLQERNNGELPPKTKCVYMAPIKALCSERFQDWSQKLSPFSVTCLELTGDTESDDYLELRGAQLILTTPEKWDSMTRKWRDNRSLIDQIRLFLVDEVHLLNDPQRGPTIEAVISRMKTVHSSHFNSPAESSGGNRSGIRLVAASATIPNCEDIAEWFGEMAEVVRVDETQRPVPLRRVVLPFSSRDMSEFKFDLSLSYKLRSVIQTYSEGKPTLVFCSTRKGTQQAACVLAREGLGAVSIECRRSLEQQAMFLKDSKLRELFSAGVAYHHAGLYTEDRRAVETAFIRGSLPVLFSTSTLAMGVNLPAHLVVIKSTQQYAEGAFREYSESQVLQMVGRAGRPQFDTHATAVIMTRHETCRKYETFLSGIQTVESYLHQNLIEHLNAEVVLGTIEEVAVALKWIKSTFLYVRVRRNPAHYLGGENTELSEDCLDIKLQEMCLKDLELLSEAELIRLNSNSRFISPTPLGRLMARFCLSFPTMKKLISLDFDSQNLGDTLLNISELQEFDDVKLRMSEKKVLNSLNRDRQRATIRHPMKGKIKSTAMKVNCLIQATLGCISFQDFTLSQDVQRIFRSAYRVSRCLLEIQLLREDFTAIHHTAALHQCINSRLWMDSHYVSKQLERVGPTISNSLVQAGLISFKKILETNPRQLELIASRHPPFGTHLINSVSSLPSYSLSVEQRMPVGIDIATIDIVLRLNNSLDLTNTNKKSQTTHSSLLIVGDSTDRRVFAKYRITDSFVMQKQDKNVSYCIKVSSSTEHKVSLKIVLKSLKFVGLDINQTFTPEFLPPIKRPCKQQQQQVHSANNNMVSHINSVKTEQNFDLGQSYYTDSPPKDQYKPNPVCCHRCFDKQLCGHACCKTGVSSLRRDTNKANRDISSPYINSKSSVMSSFLEEVNTKQGLLPSTGFSLRLKQTVNTLQEYSYNPPTPHEYTNNPTPHEYTNNPTPHEYTNNPTPHQYTNSPTTHEYTNNPTTHEYTNNPTTYEYANNPTTHEYTNNPTTHEYTYNPTPDMFTYNPPIQDKTRHNLLIQNESIYSPPIQQQPTYNPNIKEQSTYNPNIKEQSTYNHNIKEQSTYNHNIKEQPTYNRNIKEQSTYNHNIKEQPTYNRNIKEQSTYNHNIKEQSTYNHNIKEQSTYNHNIKEQSTYNHNIKEQSTYNHNIKEQSTYNHNIKEQSTYNHNIKEQSTHNPIKDKTRHKPSKLNESSYNLPIHQQSTYNPTIQHDYIYNPPIHHQQSTYNPSMLQHYTTYNPIQHESTYDSIQNQSAYHKTYPVAEESYQMPSPKFLNKNADFSVENDFDVFIDDLPIEDVIKDTIPNPVLNSVENSDQFTGSRAKHIPYCIVEPMQKSINDYKNSNSLPSNNKVVSSENDNEPFRSKRLKSFDVENSFEPPKQPEHLNINRSKQCNTGSLKFSISKPSFFLSQMELDSVNACEQEDYIDFFEH